VLIAAILNPSSFRTIVFFTLCSVHCAHIQKKWLACRVAKVFKATNKQITRSNTSVINKRNWQKLHKWLSLEVRWRAEVKVDRRKWKGVCGGVANALIATRCAIIAQRFARMCSQRKTHIYMELLNLYFFGFRWYKYVLFLPTGRAILINIK